MMRWLLLVLFASAAHAQDAPEVGDLAPTFEARTLDGETLRLGDLRGRTVLLEFWATWCAPCIVKAPRLTALYDSTDRADLEIVGVALDAAEDVRAFVDQHDQRWPQIVEPNRRGRPVTDAFGVTGYPTSFVIDPEGVIVYRGEGGEADAVAVLQGLVE